MVSVLKQMKEIDPWHEFFIHSALDCGVYWRVDILLEELITCDELVVELTNELKSGSIKESNKHKGVI